MQGQSSKVCFKCHTRQPLSDFYPHKRMADGHLNKCKECTKRDCTRHRDNHLEKVREYDRKRSRTKKHADDVREWCRKNPRKAYAQTKLRAAVAAGRLARLPCEVCGAGRAHGHHDDYTKPLSVRWLCARHHRLHHVADDKRKQREAS